MKEIMNEGEYALNCPEINFQKNYEQSLVCAMDVTAAVPPRLRKVGKVEDDVGA